MKRPEIRTWVDPIDGLMSCATASCFFIHYGYLHGFSAIVICDNSMPRYKMREAAENRWRHMLASELKGHYPQHGRIEFYDQRGYHFDLCGYDPSGGKLWPEPEHPGDSRGRGLVGKKAVA